MAKKQRHLKIKMSGDDVKSLQEILIDRSFPINDEPGYFGEETQQSVKKLQKFLGMPVTGIVNGELFEYFTTQAIVQGQITQPNGNPIANARVRVIDKRLLRKEDITVKEVETDADGKYEVTYMPERAGRTDLLVQVLNSCDEVVTRSPLIIDAAKELTIDLVVAHESYPDLPEFEQLQQRLEPFMDNTDLVELDTDAVAYLAGKSRVNPVNIAYLVQANRLAATTGIEPEAFYALLRTNLPVSLPALLVQDQNTLKQALENAAKSNVINQKIVDQSESILKTLAEQRIELLLQTSDLPVGLASLGGILDVAGINNQQKRAFAEKIAVTNSTNQTFWDALAKDNTFDEQATESVKLAIQLGTLTQNHPNLMKSLHKQLTCKRQDLRGLVSRNEAEWLRDIRQHVDENGNFVLPPDLPTVEGQLPEETYAKTIVRLIEATYPTPSVLNFLGRNDFSGADTVKDFLKQHNDIELRDQNLRVYLEENNIQITEQSREMLFAFKRAFDLAPVVNRYKVMRPLLLNKETSAYKIRKLGEAKFLARYAQAMGYDDAKRVYQAASQKSAVATALFAAHSPIVNNLGLHVLPEGNLRTLLSQGDQDVNGVLPTWEGLFGSISFCSCKHCRSVYSPAAYLVELLAFLKDQKMEDLTALEVLFKRRGDIGKIELNCHNTNTTLPYVDLVIEVQEHFLANNAADTGADWWDKDEVPQTLGEREDLRVHPENIVSAAYQTLQDRNYPWTLPFNLWTSEMRAYLEPLGVTRIEIVKLLNPAPVNEQPNSLHDQIAIETLGLIPREWGIIIGQAASGLDGWDNGTITIEELHKVKTLMNKGRLTYVEVQHLLDSTFINGNRVLNIEFADDLCDINGATLPTLEEHPHADGIHRFMRLQRKLGWSIYDLDAAIRVLGGGNIDEVFLRRLGVVKQLRDMLGTPILTLLSWWGNIDTTRRKNDGDEEEPSLYGRLFLNKSIGDNDDVQQFVLDAQGNTTHTIMQTRTAILAALNLITAEDLDLIIHKREINDELNLANLSELYRVSTMAKALKLSISGFLSLIDLTGFNPFTLEMLEDIPSKLLDVLAIINDSKTNVSEIAYILNHTFTADSVYAAGNLAIGNFLFKLRAGLQKHKNTYPLFENPIQPEALTVSPDPTGERTRFLLAQLVPNEILDRAMAVIAGTPDDQLPISTQDTFDRSVIIDEQFVIFIDDLSAFKDELINLDSTTYLDPADKLAERFHTVLEPLTRYLLETANIAFIQQNFTGLLDLNLQASDQLLGGLIKSVIDPTEPASAVFLDKTFVDSNQDTLTETDFNNQFLMVRRLQKIALLLNQLDIPSDEVRWLVEESPQLGWLDLNTIAVNANNPDSENFHAWLRMAQFACFRRQLLVHEPSLFAVLRMAHTGQDENNNTIDTNRFITDLHAVTGWNQTDIETLLDTDHFNLTFNSQFTGQQILEHLLRLFDVFQLLQRLGISAFQAWSWAVPEVTREIANEVKQAARAKFSIEQWPAVAEPIRDVLRLQQRNTLVDAALYIAGNDDIEEIADLYAYFLMDVEMNPCMLTSRIKQAISSVQLFVQRCLMNLEAGVVFDTEAAKQWEWMKNYRVWEANRKIFLYPENWIEPELRPEKSPFFTDLENELLQNDVNSDTVETAFLNYLEKLDEVARLEVASVYNDEESGTLHVLGRTKSIPHKYFYRCWKNRRHWTPWESVSVDFEGENVAITLYNRRLYLFWFMTQEKADESKNNLIRIPNSNQSNFLTQVPKTYLEFKLVWSEFRNNRWTSKTIAESILKTKSRTKTWDPNNFYPRPMGDVVGDYLTVAIEFRFNKHFQRRRQWVSGPGNYQFNDARYLFHSSLEGKGSFKFSPRSSVELPENFGDNIEVSSPVVSVAQASTTNTNVVTVDAKNGLTVDIRTGPKKYARVITNSSHPFSTIVPEQYLEFESQSPLFFENNSRIYLVLPKKRINIPGLFFPLDTLQDAEFKLTITIPDNQVRSVFDNLDQLGLVAAVISSRAESSPDFSPETNVVNGIDYIDHIPFTRDFLKVTNVYGTDSSILSNSLNANTMAIADNTSKAPFIMDRNALHAAEWVMDRGDSGNPNEVVYRNSYFCFHIYYHPYVGFLIKQLNKFGIDGLLNPIEDGESPELRRQQKKEKPNERFDQVYKLGEAINKTNLPIEEFDFSNTGSYALYNWELFFHAPLLIAMRLSANQQFEAAQKWFHYLFDPTDVSKILPEDRPYRHWKIRPFFENRGLNNIREMLKILSSNEPEDQAKREALEAQVTDWRDNPFQPHRIAEQRIVAYQKTVVMKYIDNLIAWGDNLFRRDSIESINEATQLYILAAQILGKRPEALPEPKGEKTIDGETVMTFDDLEEHLDKFGNAITQIENEMSAPPNLPEIPVDEAPIANILGSALFFCVPKNNKLLGYWDTVGDRLFKIRNCMNIEGGVRQLNLFEPPIDPGLLVRATAAGIDIGSVLNDMKAPRLQYRYSILVQKAVEFCSDVKQLGGALLSGLEKQDAEKLTLLRSSHEKRLLKAVQDIRQLQLNDAEASLAGLEKNLKTVNDRYRFYSNRDRRLSEEDAQLERLKEANTYEALITYISLIKQALALTPNFNLGGSGFGGSPVITAIYGGDNIVQALDAASHNLSILAQWKNRSANMSSITAGLKRRDEDWDFQAEQAATEIEALEKQIEGAHLRIAIAKRELENQELQIEQNREVDEFMRMKFTNEKLYSWMVDQISTIYFQSYQLAYEMAMRAQRAYQYELADYDASFINFGYWDSLKKGLLAGEQLHYDLRRMEQVYFEANKREYELTKNISLLQLTPVALIQLRENGSCEIDIPEVIFDLDYPGHIQRRIKAVSLTIPCITGPYTTVNCTLTLLNNRIRVKTDRLDENYSGFDDDRFITNVGGDQSIATSTAREDSGLFEFNFRDERYLPFEGGGSVSRWRLELPSDLRQFDYDTISDIILHMRYTSRNGGSSFKQAVQNQIDEAVNQMVDAVNQQGVFQFISMEHEFGTDFYKFLNPVGTDEHQMTITLTKQHFPFLFRQKNIEILNVIVLVKLRDVTLLGDKSFALTIAHDAGGFERVALKDKPNVELTGLAHGVYIQLSGDITQTGNWVYTVTNADVENLPSALKKTVQLNGNSIQRINADEVEDIGVLLQYKIS